MFERFDAEARAIVIGAQAEARRRRAPFIGTEHLLLAMLRTNDPLGTLLQRFGLQPDAVDAALDDLTGSPEEPLTRDAAPLASLGIDLDRVRGAIEASFGEGALTRAALAVQERRRPGHRFRRPWRNRCATRAARHPSPSGHLPFAPRSKKVLELSLREALRLGDRAIRAEHVVLGLLREGQGLACQVLAGQRVDLDALRRALEAQLRDLAA